MRSQNTKGGTKDAHLSLLEADKTRRVAATLVDVNEAQLRLLDATALELEAENVLFNIGPTVTGCGGELVVSEESKASPLAKRVVRKGQIAVNAAVERLNLIHGNDAFDLAIDTAESIGAESAVEKMMAHQIAVAHKTALELLERNKMTCDPIDEIRRVNAAARLMTVCQGAALTLQRLQTGGRQVLTVQHVTIANGGQAVIGNVGPQTHT